jgi:hypothetical protein
LWSAPITTDEDRKQLLRTLLEEVNISLHRDHTEGRADLMLRWKGDAPHGNCHSPPVASKASLRHSWGIPCHQPSDDPQEGELLTVADTANQLGLAPSTLHRWLATDSSPANSSPLAHPGGSGSPTTSARALRR